MTLVDYEELCRYWIKSPPTHLMVAAYLGVGRPAEAQTATAPAKSSQDAIAEILQGGGAAVISQKIFEKNMPFTPTFDSAELFARRPERRPSATTRT
jgi:hypothetical protein